MSETDEGISAARASEDPLEGYSKTKWYTFRPSDSLHFTNEQCVDTDCSDIVSVNTGHRGKVFDAHGDEVRFCIEANLLTGRCVVFAKDEFGTTLKTAVGGLVKRAIEMRAAPLRFVPNIKPHDTSGNMS